MNDLKITILQSGLYWENKEKNLNMFSEKIASVSESTDLIVLPEMFTTGFSMQPARFAEAMSGETISWMREKAKEKNAVITGSFICGENSSYYNRLVWMRPDGTYSVYDKHHLFSMGDENNYYTAGTKRIIEEWKGWKICPLVCYDLRFPVWARNIKKDPYDLLIYVANWPERRAGAWKTLLPARAVENQCYVAGLNRVGNDGNGIDHSGDSVVIDMKGERISKTAAHEERAETVLLSHAALLEFRQQFPVLNDADDFTLSQG